MNKIKPKKILKKIHNLHQIFSIQHFKKKKKEKVIILKEKIMQKKSIILISVHPFKFNLKKEGKENFHNPKNPSNPLLFVGWHTIFHEKLEKNFFLREKKEEEKEEKEERKKRERRKVFYLANFGADCIARPPVASSKSSLAPKFEKRKRGEKKEGK